MNTFNAERFKAQLEKLKINGVTENEPTLAADFSKFEYFSFLQAYNELVQFIYTLPVDDLIAIEEKLEELDNQIKTLTTTVSEYTTKVDAALEDITQFKTDINSQVTNINSTITQIQSKLSQIGELSLLQTNEKGTIVGAINELHTQNTYDRYYGIENGILSDALGCGLQHWNQKNLPRECNSTTSQIPYDFGNGVRTVDFFNEKSICVNLYGKSKNTNRAEVWRNYYNGSNWAQWTHFGLSRLDFLKRLDINTGTFTIPNSSNYNYLILICNNTAFTNSISFNMMYMSNNTYKLTNTVFNGNDIYVVSTLTITRADDLFTIVSNDELWIYADHFEKKTNQNRLYIQNVLGLTV